jgi:sugar lactone lactonase YvrE
MKRILKLIGMLLLVLVAYLALWPVPIDPQAWDAPISEGYTGAFAQNSDLADLDRISIGEHHGPEDVAGRIEDGRMIVYVSTQSGDIIRIDPEDDTHEVIANTGGVALGVQFDANGNLIIADAHKGLLSMDADHKITVLTDTAEDGSPIAYADELDIAADGKIYFSDASTKFGAAGSDSTLSASLLEIMEHGNTGRVLVYDPLDGSTKTIMDNLSFANGIAMCPDDACFLVAETGSYRVHKFWLTGEKAGTSDVIIDNLPGFPDNINRGLDGRYWIGLTSPRSDDLDKLSGKPGIRKMVQRLPASMRPQAELYGFILAIDVDGNVLAQYQDPAAGYPLTTGATEPGDGWLYIGSLGATYLGRKDIREEF